MWALALKVYLVQYLEGTVGQGREQTYADTSRLRHTKYFENERIYGRSEERMINSSSR